MAIGIPLRKDIPSYEFKVSLDGTTYTLLIRYNARKDRWVMDFKTENGVMIVAGTPLLLGTSLLKRYQDKRIPPGDLFVLNIQNENVEANRNNLSENALLLYEEAA